MATVHDLNRFFYYAMELNGLFGLYKQECSIPTAYTLFNNLQ